MDGHKINIVFVREYKNFISVYSKKSREDYILNVSKIIKEKFDTKSVILNRVQSFLLNYEIKKLLDKAINIKNKKYKRVVYLNSNISASIIMNTMDLLEDEYPDHEFSFDLLESSDVEDGRIEVDRLNVIYLS